MDNIENLKQWLADILDKEVYEGDINEYIDWTTGINEVTGSKIQGVDDDTKISGGSIRRLILEKLKIPFITYRDDPAGYIRFFSSTAAKNLYLNLLEQGDEESIQKANDLVLYNMDMPATYRITGMDGFTSARYIIEGNSTSTNAQLDLLFGIEDSLGSSDSDVLTVSYLIIDNTGNTQYNSADLIETGLHVIKSIYRYLRSGENKVTISVSANNHNAKTTKSFSIYLVTFSINTNFSGYYTPIANNTPFSFDIFINRSITNLPIETTVTIDGSIAKQTDANRSDAKWRYAENNANPTKRMEIYNNAEIYLPSSAEVRRKHIMTIESVMKDEETNTTFSSNILTYEFEVSPAEDDLTHTYINLATSISNSQYHTESFTDVDGSTRVLPIIKATQYLPMTVDWGYNTDSFGLLQEANVEWAIKSTIDGNTSYETVANILGIKGTKPETLTFIPSLYLSYEDNSSYLVARIPVNGTLTDIALYPISVEKSSMTVAETTNYSLKLSAYGKTNTSENKTQWVDTINNISTTFSSGVTFDSSNGWDNNSLLLKGENSYAIIGYCAFPSTYNGVYYSIPTNGATFEIDFKPEYVSTEGDILITIGDPTKLHIRINTNSAGYYTGNTPVVKTNFKSGERIKLAFIFNRAIEGSNTSNLVYIVNNGILERAAERGNALLTDDAGRIKIGGSNSSVRVYMIRAYRQDISPKLALNNYMFDNATDVNLISRNDVYGNSSEVTYAGMQGKQDIVIIEGDLTNILSNKEIKENATVNIRRESNVDSIRNFTIENSRARNHGQSTLSYPRTSIKIWFNKSNKFDEQTGTVEVVPTFYCLNQQYLGLNKNRYIFKLGAIPSNKYVLQANYADSSGANNGSLLRLINDTWYNAQFGTGNNKQYKLRTSPQLFASGAKITHDNELLNEDGSWVEGVYNIPNTSSNYVSEFANKTWPEITNKDFPYQIRVAPDSFPCTVFYRDTSTDSLNLTLLGQYVFMDDKKSDYVYGERSIYYTDDTTDPFCLKTENSKKDKGANKVWDNDKVLQIEVVYPNSPLTSYNSKILYSSYHLDENDELIPDEGATQTPYNAVTATDSSGNPTEYLWEQHFELIYPDKEDITDKNGNFDSAKFTATVKPFGDFLEWITDVAALRSTGTKGVIDGVTYTTGAKSFVTLAELDKFIAEAHDHLDLYKLAGYYIFYLRFGLVDSVERNAQLKTYDGIHWHYEPWDMDIALGRANNGVIAYEPPLTRDSKTAGGGYVFSGRTSTQSNVLWDCLESWDYWSKTIVPEVAQALYDAGLTYDNVIKMFDKEYVEKWSETLYNESGQYKYIDVTSVAKYRLYLNGAGTSHRHWWLSKSMNYYDAKWECGDFTKNSIVFRMKKDVKSANTNLVKIYPTLNTFFEIVYGAAGNQNPVGAGLVEAGVAAGHEAIIDASLDTFGDKQPTFIYGATSIEKLDMSALLSIGNYYTDINFGGSYDAVLGASIKELYLGAQCTPNIYDYPNEDSYESNYCIGQNDIAGLTLDENGNSIGTTDGLENLEVLDVIGWKSSRDQAGGWLSGLMSENGHARKNIHTLYALGCNMATEFATSSIGNNFKDLRLPDSITTLSFTNSSWENLSFWSTTELGNGRALYDKVGIPATIDTIILRGTTGKNECSLKLVLDWIDAIEDSLPVSHTEEDLYEALQQKTLVVEQAYWGNGTYTLTYQDVLRLAYFRGDGSLHPIKGYVIIQSDLIGMTPSRVTYLQTLFGENVFNIGTTNANLVVDYQNDLIVISISGIEKQLTIDENENIWIEEPNSAKLNANHFTLSLEQNVNYIVDNEENNPLITSNLADGRYIWGFVDSLDAPLNALMTASLSYATLNKGNDGIIRVYTSEGNGNDYTMYVRVVYGKLQNNTLLAFMDTIAVKVKGVTYPSDYMWSVTGTGNILKFRYNQDIAKSLFGNSLALQLGNNADIYVFNTNGQKLEFALTPAEPKYYTDGSGNQQMNWTANENNEVVTYMAADKGNATEQSSGGFSLYINRTVFAANTGNPIAIGTQLYLSALDNATHGGIPLQTASSITLPTNPILYQINGNAKIGGKDTISKTIYCIVINDPNPVIYGSLTDLSVVMWNTYTTLYNLSSGAALNMYRTHLLSLYGTIDFTLNITITSLITANGDTVLKYIPHVTSLNFEGCASIPRIDVGYSADNFDFLYNVNLQSLSLKGCTSLNGYEFTFANCTNLESLDTRGTTIGVILPSGSKITTLLLGSPTTLQLNSPTSLGESGTTYSILSNANLTDIRLIGVNQTNNKGFTMFDSLYTGSV